MLRMKTIFLTAIGLVLFHWTIGQTPGQPAPQSFERSSGNLPVISEERSFLESAKGWMLQDNGEWISGKNKIPFKEFEANRSSKDRYKLGKENFSLLQLREVVVNGQTYSIFIMRYRTGWYEFPILLKGWHNQEGLSFFVFKKSKLLQVLPDSVVYNKPMITNLEVVCEGTLLDYNKKTFLNTVAYQIQKAFVEKTIASHNLLIAVLPVRSSGQDLARFRLLNVVNRKKVYLPYMDPGNVENMFRNSYYETDLGTFRSFIRYGS
jgi:hypothetical protein